jgi:alkylation response protein AidB-like acyl-CoA dehydrogenase
MLQGLDIERITIAAIPVGIAQGALDVALQYSTERKQFGVEIATFQLIKKFLADMATETRASRLLVYDAAWRLDHGEKGLTMEASMAKYYASEVGTRVALNAVQVLGGYGYISEFPVERMARDAKLLEIGAGTSEIQRIIVARELIRKAGLTVGEG